MCAEVEYVQEDKLKDSYRNVVFNPRVEYGSEHYWLEQMWGTRTETVVWQRTVSHAIAGGMPPSNVTFVEFYFSMAPNPLVGQGLLIIKDSFKHITVSRTLLG